MKIIYRILLKLNKNYGKTNLLAKNPDILNKYILKSISLLYKNVKLLKKINNYGAKIN